MSVVYSEDSITTVNERCLLGEEYGFVIDLYMRAVDIQSQKRMRSSFLKNFCGVERH